MAMPNHKQAPNGTPARPDHNTPGHLPGRTRRVAQTPRRSTPMMRTFRVQYLSPQGVTEGFQRVAPALPVFEEAFSAFVRGTLISTEFGLMAVEDLTPGIRVLTVENGLQTLLWRGSITLIPGSFDETIRTNSQTRIAADRFGLGCPLTDIILGPSAHIYQSQSRGASQLGAGAASFPARGFVDGESVIQITSASPVESFHLAFNSHQIVLANGLPCESYHPGKLSATTLTGEMRNLFLSLFPHLNSLQDFGALRCPRVSEDDMMMLA